MRKKSIEVGEESRAEWETLEAFARQGMQRLLQRVLKEEVDELLDRGRYERRTAVDAPLGYRNGFGKPRRLSLSNGTITLRRPRVRGLSERFESRLLPAFKRSMAPRAARRRRAAPARPGRSRPRPARAGTAPGGAGQLPRCAARLKAGWQAEHELWKTRSVSDLEVVYLWVDGVYVKAGLEKEKGRSSSSWRRCATGRN